MKARRIILLAAGALLSVSAFLYITRREVPVLIYHHLLTDSENTAYRNSSVITPEKFEQQMRWLYENGYKTVTSEELYEFVVNKKSLPGKRVMLTFDDGYLSNYVYAYDILRQYGFTAVLFLITSEINETPQQFEPDKLVFLSIPEIEAMREVFEFGSHTHAMHSTTEDNTPFIIYVPDEDFRADLEQSYSFPYVERLFSYPFGYFKRSNLTTLKQYETQLAFTIGRGGASKFSHRFKVPRVSVRGDITLEEFKALVE